MFAARTGIYGKVAAKGDFITRRLPKAMVEPWDAWLRHGLAASQQCLGEAWLDRYLGCPIWRFAISAGLCGPQSIIGILMPSVDRACRYFPLTLAVPVGTAAPAWAAVAAADWFTAAEPVALQSLSDECEFEAWNEDVEALALSLPEAPSGPEAMPRFLPMTLADGEQPEAAYPALLDVALRASLARYSLWWTIGSDRAPASLVLSQGLPEPDAFAGLLSGGWQASTAPVVTP